MSTRDGRIPHIAPRPAQTRANERANDLSSSVQSESEEHGKSGSEIVWALTTGQQVPVRPSKRLADQDALRIRNTRQVGACSACRRSKRRCQHIQASADEKVSGETPKLGHEQHDTIAIDKPKERAPCSELSEPAKRTVVADDCLTDRMMDSCHNTDTNEGGAEGLERGSSTLFSSPSSPTQAVATSPRDADLATFPQYPFPPTWDQLGVPDLSSQQNECWNPMQALRYLDSGHSGQMIQGPELARLLLEDTQMGASEADMESFDPRSRRLAHPSQQFPFFECQAVLASGETTGSPSQVHDDLPPESLRSSRSWQQERRTGRLPHSPEPSVANVEHDIWSQAPPTNDLTFDRPSYWSLTPYEPVGDLSEVGPLPTVLTDNVLQALQPSPDASSASQHPTFPTFEASPDEAISSSQTPSRSTPGLHRNGPESSAESATHKCHVCGAGFHSSSHLKFHQRIHQEDRERHPCPLCDRNFRYPKDMRRHQLIHNSDPITFYYCRVPGCKRGQHGFKRRDHWVRHLSYHSKIDARTEWSDRVEPPTEQLEGSSRNPTRGGSPVAQHADH